MTADNSGYKRGEAIMALSEKFKIETKIPHLYLSGYKGHFVAGRSHLNYYIDITSQKSRLSEAKAVAKAIAPNYKLHTEIDTILCLDGTEVIGTCLASELTKNDLASINANREINILAPEYTASNQLMFRDNIVQMISGKRVLVLAASVVTGSTAQNAFEAIRYYSGTPVGIASIFATMKEYEDFQIASVFDPQDLPEYESHSAMDCPLCKKGERIDALINSFGCSML